MSATPTTKPRRWNAEIDGIVWLPRMIDKTRMRDAGALGRYLYGHSPIDRALLARLHTSTDAFAAIVRRCEDDAAVVVAMRTQGFDEERFSQWTSGFAKRYRLTLWMLDLDEGYREPRPFERPLVALVNAIEAPLMVLVRKVWKAP